MFLYQNIYLNTSGKPGCKWIIQWTNAFFLIQTPMKSKTAINIPMGVSRGFQIPENFHVSLLLLMSCLLLKKIWRQSNYEKRGLPSKVSGITAVVSFATDNILRVFGGIAPTWRVVTESLIYMRDRVNIPHLVYSIDVLRFNTSVLD